MNDNVFINCPFDEDYRDCFKAVLFTLTVAGYSARCALEESDSGDIRFNKLCRMVGVCDTTIHDLSRVELSAAGLPRFNMPLELGITLGAKHFGGTTHSAKRVMIMVAKPFEMPRYMSDLSGNDPHIHDSNPQIVIRVVRNFLHTAPNGVMLPGADSLFRIFEDFQSNLLAMAAKADLTPAEVDPLQGFRNYMQVLRSYIEGIRKVPAKSKTKVAHRRIRVR